MPDDFDDLDLEIEDEAKEVTKPVIKSKTPAAQSKTPVSGTDSGPRKNVFFKSTVGPERTEKLAIGTRTPVRDVKDTLANIFGLNPDDFHLSHAGRTMDETAPIGDYSLENGDEILMIPQSTAGAGERRMIE